MFKANNNVFHWNISGKSTKPLYDNMMHDFKIKKDKKVVNTTSSRKEPIEAKKDGRMKISFIIN